MILSVIMVVGMAPALGSNILTQLFSFDASESGSGLRSGAQGSRGAFTSLSAEAGGEGSAVLSPSGASFSARVSYSVGAVTASITFALSEASDIPVSFDYKVIYGSAGAHHDRRVLAGCVG